MKKKNPVKFKITRIKKKKGSKKSSIKNNPLFKIPAKIFQKVAKTVPVLLFVLLVTVLVSSVLASATYAYFANDISNPDRLINRNNTGTVVYDRNEKVLYQTFGAKYRKLLELEQIPDHMEKAAIAAEDQEFYKHKGISTKGIARAFLKNVQAGEFREGGSSITQQLVKNALLSPDRSFSRKYKEVILSFELERKYTKDDILKMYLNEIYYGEGAWGIEDAAKVYFGKEAKDLTLGESAILAGLPSAPSRWSPITNPKGAEERQNYVLSRMKEAKMITDQDVVNAKNEKITYVGQKIEIKAPHFVMAVMDQLRSDYGDDVVEKGGLRVHTTLDLDKQKAAEDAVLKELPKLRAKNANNASIVSSDPKTGEILAFVGSADWGNEAWGKVSIPFTDQQPGSSFKPFAYITAMKKGWTTTTNIKDEPVTFKDDPPYVPKNYDGKFHGNVSLRKALANSYNIPAIKAMDYAGIDETIALAKDVGITTFDRQKYKYGLSLVVGGGDVRLIDMVTGYGTLANGGTYIKPKFITKVVNNDNKDITKEEKKEDKKKVLDAGYTFIMSDVLSDNEARKDTFGPNSPLKLSRPAAAKTGTTNDYKDGWTMGYTPNLVTGVWLGNNDNSSMQELPGALGAGYIWNSYMEAALKGMPVENFEKPSNVVEKWIWTNGAIAKNGTVGAKKEYFIEGTEPKGKETNPNENKDKPKAEPKKEEPRKEEKTTTAAPAPAPTPTAPTPQEPPKALPPPPPPPPPADPPPPPPPPPPADPPPPSDEQNALNG